MFVIIIIALFFFIIFCIAIKRRCQVRATSEIYLQQLEGVTKKIMQIHVHNTGRHQILLRALVLKNGQREDRIFFSPNNKGDYQTRFHGLIALFEGESHDVIVGLHSLRDLHNYTDSALNLTFYIEDTTGQRFLIKKAKANIRHLFRPIVF